MSRQRKNRYAFRPTLDSTTLEDRVVLNAARPTLAAAAIRPAATTSQSAVTPQQIAQARYLYSQQFRASAADLMNYADSQIRQAYTNAGVNVNGRLSSAQLNALTNNIAGAVNATTARLSAQFGLLPGAQNLVSGLQSSLIGNQPSSLINQINGLNTSYNGVNNQRALLGSANNLFNRSLTGNFNQLGNFFGSTNFNTGSVLNGQSVPLSQYMGAQAINLFNNQFAALGSAVPTAAGMSIYDASGNLSTDPTVLNNFNTGLTSALGNANYLVGNALSVIPGVNTNSYFQQLGTSLYGDGTSGNTGFFGNLSGLTSTNPSFSTYSNDVTNAFNSAYSTLASPLYSLMNQMAPTSNPVTSNATGIFGNNYIGNSYYGGINNGFGAGYSGLGAVPSNYQTFASGNNALVTSYNSNLGLSGPIGTGGFPGGGFFA